MSNLELREKWKELYFAINELMSQIGAGGQISMGHASVYRVMDALYALDGGTQIKDGK